MFVYVYISTTYECDGLYLTECLLLSSGLREQGVVAINDHDVIKVDSDDKKVRTITIIISALGRNSILGGHHKINWPTFTGRYK